MIFHTMLGFTRAVYTKGAYTIKEPPIISGIDKTHLKYGFN